MRKVTLALERKIRSGRLRGAKIADLAKRHGVSVGSVHAVLAKPPPAPPPEKDDAAPGPEKKAPAPAGAPSYDDIRTWVGEQVVALRGDCKRFRAANNVPALATATRSLTSATALLERLTPEPRPIEEKGAFTDLQMAEAAGRAEKTLLQIAHNFYKEAAKWPACASCGQPIAPADLPQTGP